MQIDADAFQEIIKQQYGSTAKLFGLNNHTGWLKENVTCKNVCGDMLQRYLLLY